MFEELGTAIDQLHIPTDGAALTAVLCSRHHHLLHSPGRHAKLLPDNTLEVTDPRGHVHTSHPGPGRPPP